jgi:hypothetical protein
VTQRFSAVGALLAVVVILIVAAPPPAHATFAAAYDGQCCWMTLEPGDLDSNWFDFRNTGDQTWSNSGPQRVVLGTQVPENRYSPFFVDGDWLDQARPTAVDQPTVAPGAVGRFTYRVKAPEQPGTYREFFAPLIEGLQWLTPDKACCFLDLTVISAQAPTVRITSAPARVKRGETFSVSADATDNRAIDHVTFSVGKLSAAVPASGRSQFSAILSSGDLAAGTQTVAARAFDLGGRESVATSSFEVYDTPTGPSTTTPAPTTPVPPSGGPVPTTTSAVARFLPRFGIRPRRGGGSRLGLLTLVSGFGKAADGSRVRISCVRDCRGGATFVVRRSGKRRRTSTHLRRPWTLTKQTIVEVSVARPGHLARFARFKFQRRDGVVFAHRISSGCLASQMPRTRATCP